MDDFRAPPKNIFAQFGPQAIAPETAAPDVATPSVAAPDGQNIFAKFGPSALPPDTAKTTAPSEGMPGERRTAMSLPDIGGAGVLGAVAGAGTPEMTALLGKGLSMVPYPPVKAAGMALQEAAPAMKFVGGRVMPAIYGALGGAGGEATKQGLEIAGVRPSIAQAAGTTVEMVSQPVLDLGWALTKGLTKVANIDQAFKSVAAHMGIDPATLSSADKQYIVDQVKQLRGEGDAEAIRKQLFGELKTGAEKIQGETNAAATARQREAESAAMQAFTDAGKVPSEADAALVKSQNQVHQIGDANKELTDIGDQQRKAVLDRFTEEKLARDKNYQELKAERDAAVAAREDTGDYISNLPYYKQLRNKLNAVLLEGKIPSKVGTAPETEKGTLSAYDEIKIAMSPRRKEVSPAQAAQQAARGVQIEKIGEQYFRVFEPSFNAIDTVRRKLGDAAFGQGEEGFKAIGEARAKEWYGYLSDLQSKYAGQVQDELQGGYELASGYLERFKGGAGAKVLKTEKVSPDMFTQSPEKIPATFFGSRSGVEQLQALTKDADLVQQTASDYVARSLNGKSADQAAAWLDKNSDFLSAPQLKGIRQKAVDYADNLAQTENQTKAAKIGAEAKSKIAEKTFASETTASEAMRTTAQARVNALLGDRAPAERINQMLSNPSQSQWAEVATVLKDNPKGRDLLTKALDMHLADIAERNPKSFAAIDALREVAAPMLEAGLVDKAYVDGLQAQLAKIQAPESVKLSWLKTNLLRGLSTVTGATAGAYAGNKINALLSQQPNQNALAQ